MRGFPTIMFINGKDKSVVSYAGDRTYSDLKAFVNRRGAPKPDDADDEDDELDTEEESGDHEEL